MRLKKEGYRVSNSFNSLRKTLDWPVNYSQIGYPDNLPQDFKYIQCRHGKLICWLHDGMLYPCPATFLRPEYAVPIESNNIEDAWHKLAKKVSCVACGGSDESTTLFALELQDLKEAFFRVIENNIRFRKKAV